VTTTRARRNRPTMRPRLMVLRRWACAGDDCTQDRITPLATTVAPICPKHGFKMTKRRVVTRRRGL
jgi:hypothetical protein